jgi:hypothetical protein
MSKEFKQKLVCLSKDYHLSKAPSINYVTRERGVRNMENGHGWSHGIRGEEI